ncbi:hypothetical protein DFS33DRAFT_1380621 [Desarmillaria ectypa]|nr:hypothetical protein DFS33DRAFT_1380621 [Desarmillaria ectypa]
MNTSFHKPSEREGCEEGIFGKRKAGVKARKDTLPFPLLTKDTIKHAKKCAEWADSMSESLTKELDDIRKQRSKAIETRLTSLGHGEEIAYIKDLEKTGSWSERRALTLLRPVRGEAAQTSHRQKLELHRRHYVGTHLANKHDADTPVEDIDYFRALELSPEQPLIARMVPKAVTSE